MGKAQLVWLWHLFISDPLFRNFKKWKSKSISGHINTYASHDYRTSFLSVCWTSFRLDTSATWRKALNNDTERLWTYLYCCMQLPCFTSSHYSTWDYSFAVSVIGLFIHWNAKKPLCWDGRDHSTEKGSLLTLFFSALNISVTANRRQIVVVWLRCGPCWSSFVYYNIITTSLTQTLNWLLINNQQLFY